MGDPEVGPVTSGLVISQAAAYADSFVKSRSIDNARWLKAEQLTGELIKRIQGTPSSEERRKDVTDYVVYLIRTCFDCEVYHYGSVPLKTYLPDGDIDLTIVSRDPQLKDIWYKKVRKRLEEAERNQEGKFRVKEIQYIDAEVKLIKCHVENIVVDISFNQFGGLCTFCFLEEVDRWIGKNHVFKRSVILIKAWCYYDVMILGAHHALISTYALETLVLYIFHVFHPSLRGPLEVLLRFLEVFSKFDWQKYAVSVRGPVLLSSLPEIIVESPRRDGGELLLNKDFLDACVQEYGVGQDSSQGRAFTAKHLNVVDPLRSGNNLGRSVNRANFTRIISALKANAKNLLQVLLDPSKDIDEYFEDKKAGFFKRTQSRLDQFEQKRPDAATTRYEGLHYHIYQNGFSNGNFDNGHASQSSLAETNNVEPNLSCAVNDTTVVGRASSESTFDGGVLGGTISNSSSVPESSYISGFAGGKGSLTKGEAVAKPSGLLTKSSIDSVIGSTDKASKASKQQDDGRGSFGSSTQSSEGRDFASSVDDFAWRASVANRSSYTQTNFDSNGAVVSSSESPSSESSRGSVSTSNEGVYEGVRISTNHSIESDASRRSSWVGEHASYVPTSGVLDGQGYAQQRGQDSVTRGPIPVSFSQVQVTMPHSVQMPMHLATSLPVSQTITGPTPSFGLHVGNINSSSIIGESPPGIGSRVGPYMLPRGPAVPPLPPGFFLGSPYLSTMGEMPNVASRIPTSYPVQQGDEQSFEQHQLWQQMEAVQLHGHGYFRPISTINAALPSPQFLNTENSVVMSSAPAVVTSGPSHHPVNLPAPRSPALSSTGSRNTHSGGGANPESLARTSHAEDVPEDEIGKYLTDHGEIGDPYASGDNSHIGSEAGARAIKNTKSGKEKRLPKVKSASNDDAVAVGVSDVGMPSVSGEESSGHQPIQAIADDTVQMRQGHPQLISVTGPTLGPSIYPYLLSSSLPHGTGFVAPEFSSYPPPMVLTPKSFPSQTSIQPSSLPVGIPNSSSNSSWLPTAELVNGASNYPTKQRPRPAENAPLPPPSVYFPTGNPYLSTYNTANANWGYVVTPSPDQTYHPELYSGMHLSKPFDSYSDVSASQGDDSRLRFPQQVRAGVGERLRAAVVSTSEAATTDERTSDTLDSNFVSGDLLRGDLNSNLRHLDFARWCQSPRVPIPLQTNAAQSPRYYPWEGPGRPLAPFWNYAHGIVHGPSSVAPMRMVVFPRSFTGPGSYSSEELPKSHGGTGTYLPNPRPHFIRDRQSAGNGRNQHGGYSQDRGDRVDRDANQGQGQRPRGSGRGQSKYEARPQSSNGSVERNNADLKAGERSRDRDSHKQNEGQRRNPTVSGTGTAFASPIIGVSPVMTIPQVPAGLPVEMYSVPNMTVNGNSSTSGTVAGTIPSVMATNQLKFGSIGEGQDMVRQAGSEVDNGAGHTSSLRPLEQVNAQTSPGLAGLSLASGDGSSQGPSSPKQRVVQGAYQLKEEDFPPLSSRGQH
ncbi:unnamed protein product [Calypogeia fissa]